MTHVAPSLDLQSPTEQETLGSNARGMNGFLGVSPWGCGRREGSAHGCFLQTCVPHPAAPAAPAWGLGLTPSHDPVT